MDSQGPIFFVRNLDFYYGDFQALIQINMDILPQRVTALIGPSGCGKSTFLRCLNRMNDTIPGIKVEGEIRLQSEDIYAPETVLSDLRRRVGMVFQKSNPFPKTIFENVAYGLRISGMRGTSEIEAVVEESLKKEAGARALESSLIRHLEAAAFDAFSDPACCRVSLDMREDRIVFDLS